MVLIAGSCGRAAAPLRTTTRRLHEPTTRVARIAHQGPPQGG
jgi:hypothetical protein